MGFLLDKGYIRVLHDFSGPNLDNRKRLGLTFGVSDTFHLISSLFLIEFVSYVLVLNEFLAGFILIIWIAPLGYIGLGTEFTGEDLTLLPSHGCARLPLLPNVSFDRHSHWLLSWHISH